VYPAACAIRLRNQRKEKTKMNLTNTKPVIIVLDHGYGNIKTAHAIFKTGVTVCE
jgi:hypothetical protein